MEIVNVGPGKNDGEIEVDIAFDYDEEFVKNYMKEHNTTFEAALMAYQGTTKESGREFAELQEEVKNSIGKIPNEVIGNIALAVLEEMERNKKEKDE